ncbi:MAG TPA: hypothetical protein VMV49_15330 [Candidatus Deferrimicrobium sp.]|nr:hypothetical protein [Candidatus Deferrimicrobium sp.]
MPILIEFKFTMPIGGFSVEYYEGAVTLFTAPSDEEKVVAYFSKEFKISNAKISHEEATSKVTFRLEEDLTLTDLLHFIEKYKFPAMGHAIDEKGNFYSLDDVDRGKIISSDDYHVS